MRIAFFESCSTIAKNGVAALSLKVAVSACLVKSGGVNRHASPNVTMSAGIVKNGGTAVSSKMAVYPAGCQGAQS